MASDLSKKWRIDTVHVHELGAQAGIYVRPGTGLFYARVPECPSGTLIEDSTKSGLEEKVRAALREHTALSFRKVIRVEYAGLMRWSPTHGRGGSVGRGAPFDGTHGGDAVGPLIFRVIEVAQQPDGGEVLRTVDGRLEYTPKMRRGVADDSNRDAPWTAELEAALLAFQERIRELDASIRRLILSDDFEARLLKVASGALPPAPQKTADGSIEPT